MNDHTKDALPKLPKHLAEIDGAGDSPTFAALTDHAWDSDYASDLKLGAPLFTAGQMRDYACSAIAATASKPAATEFQEMGARKEGLFTMPLYAAPTQPQQAEAAPVSTKLGEAAMRR